MPEQDDDASELKEAEEVRGLAFEASNEFSEVTEGIFEMTSNLLLGWHSRSAVRHAIYISIP